MKRLIATRVLILLTTLLLLPTGCTNKTVPSVPAPAASNAPLPTVEWEKINFPAIGEEGNWKLAEEIGIYTQCAFSTDLKTIYCLGSNSHVFLRKSDDNGLSWTTLSGLDQFKLWEAFFIATAGENLFVGTRGNGIYRSQDGGKSFVRLPPPPGIEKQRSIMCSLDVVLDSSGQPLILAGTRGSDETTVGGLWLLAYPYAKWVDMKIGNANNAGRCNAWQAVFSPNYAIDKQIIALAGDWEHLWVTFKHADEPWGASVIDTPIPGPNIICDLDTAFSRLTFPDDYNWQSPVVYVGIGYYTEHIYQTPQYADVYRIDGKPTSSGFSEVTDLNVGGLDTSTPVYSMVIKGNAGNASIWVGSVGQIFRSDNGGKTWQASTSPPTGGAIIWLGSGPPHNNYSPLYCTSTDPGNCLVPRNAHVDGEQAFSSSSDGGITWDQLSLIGTTFGEVLSRVVSPHYASDNTLFVLSRSCHLLIASFTLDEVITITAVSGKSGTRATVNISPSQAIPPREQMRIGSTDYDSGNEVSVVLDDTHPSISVMTPPIAQQKYLSEQDKWLRANYDSIKSTYPWWVEQWETIYNEPRQVLISLIDGAVIVTKNNTAVPFPSVESLWRSTDSGKTWERILTSGLKLTINGQEVPVGPLASIALSSNFSKDHRLIVNEGGTNPRVWVSPDGGASFNLQK